MIRGLRPARTLGRCPATGKLRFSGGEVTLALLLCQAKGRPECRAFVCEACGDWHLTHKRPQLRRAC